MKRVKEILDLRIEYDIEEETNHFTIRFSPIIGGEHQEGGTKRVSIKFVETLLEEFSKIYQFYKELRELREAKVVQISDVELDILSTIDGDTAKDKLEIIGKKIHGLVPPQIKNDLKNISCVTINSKKFLIPFELMHDGDSFLATRIEFYRNPIFRKGKKEKPSISSKAKSIPGTIVFCTNPTKDLEAAEEEVTRIINFFQNTKKKLNLDIKEYKQEGASYSVLANTFPSHRLDIFHYSGHSKITKKDIYFKLLYDSLSVSDIILHYPALFFLNMCEADVTVQHKVVFEGYKSLNFPIALMQKGAKACIATFWPIVDRSAADFATIFYQRVIEEGETFGTAIYKAKEILELRSDPNDITWMSFVLYGDPRKAILDGIVERLDKEMPQPPSEVSKAKTEEIEIKPATISKKYAFLVGIGDSHFKSLPFAVRHVNELEKILEDSEEFEEIIVLRSDDSDIDHLPNRGKIKEHFSHLIEKIRDHDLIIIYFICYGGYFNNKNYIFPENVSKENFENQSIPLLYFDEKLKKLNVEDWNAFFFLDIHQEELEEIPHHRVDIKPITINKEDKVSGISKFWAYNSETKANSFNEKGKDHSIFSYALLNGLKGDILKPITYGKLVSHLKIEVTRIAKAQNKIQEPLNLSAGTGNTKSLLGGEESTSLGDVVQKMEENQKKIHEIVEVSPSPEKFSPVNLPRTIDKIKNPYINPVVKAAREKLREKQDEIDDADRYHKYAIIINELKDNFRKITSNYKENMIDLLIDKIDKAEDEEDEIVAEIYQTALKSIQRI